MVSDTNIIDGRQIALQHQAQLKERIKSLITTPKIVSILIGEDPASVMYSNMKQKKASEVGIDFELKKFSVSIPFNEVVSEIEQLNQDTNVDGIMIQLPVPKEFLGGHTQDELIQKINPSKDVDGLTGKGPVPQATVRGVISILEYEQVDLFGKTVVIVGAKGTVGKGLVDIFEDLGTNVVGVDIETKDLKSVTKKADVLISATGRKNLITADMVKNGATVIDVGMDVDFENVKEVAGKITPPKGGVGPMTVISLMENAVDLVEMKGIRDKG